MASTNGDLNPPVAAESIESSNPASTKRKRDHSSEAENDSNGIDSPSINGAALAESEEDFMQDLIDVLKAEDPTPSVLSRPLDDASASTEPQAKRKKSQDGNETKTTILTRFGSKAYKNVNEILSDIDVAVGDIKSMLQSRSDDLRSQYLPESETALRVTAFKERAHTLVAWEKAARDRKPTSLGANGNTGTNGSNQSIAKLDENKLVLTVYGNAPGPKQLFSSLQKPAHLDGLGFKIKVTQPLRDAMLPSGVNTTQIVPVNSTGLWITDKKKVQTLGELFPTPASLPVAQPPKPSKTATTRSNVVGWYQPSPKDFSPRAPGYLTQNITAGQWLDYSKSNTTQDIKRRHRDRAMSLGGSKAVQVDAEIETEATKLDALFRSAYSGFAPTRDESAAVVSEDHTTRIWWQKNGERSYERLVENSEHILEVASIEKDLTDDLDELDLEQLQEMAEMDLDTIDPSLVPIGDGMEKAAQDKDAEEVLAGISDLLEELNSFQRIRHLSLNASARPGGILATSDNSSTGTPTKPSDAEQATYETLKAALKLMIETLPPYAVAKLDPDRLADLRISTKIEVEQEDYKGAMEEDEASARARAALAASAASRNTATAPLHRTNSSNQMYSNQYPGQQNVNSQYYRPTTTPIRPPSNNMQRQPATISAPYQPRPVSVPSPAYRPAYGTPTYPQQAQQNVRQNPVQYGSSGQQYHQAASNQPYMRPQTQTQGYPQTGQSMPQTPMNGGYPRQSFPQQGQPAQNGLNYQYNPGGQLRQASPHKLYSPQQTPVQPRPYGTPTPTPSQHGPTRPPYPQNTVPQPHLNGGQSQSPQPPFQRQNSGPMNYSTYMTSAEQSSLLERQKAQLAQQQGLQQQQARSAAQAALGSPSKNTTNGNYSVTAGQ